MTPEQRQAARARCEAATEGPWRAKCSGYDYPYIVNSRGQLGCGTDFGKMPDAEFIAAARTDLPAALDVLDAILDAKDKRIAELEGECERMREYADKLVDAMPGLPKDLEVLRIGNTNLANENAALRARVAELEGECERLREALTILHAEMLADPDTPYGWANRIADALEGRD